MRGRRWWVLLLLLAACTGVRADHISGRVYGDTPEREAAVRRLQDAHRAVLESDSAFYKALLRSPIDGDSERLRLATAAFVIIHVQYTEEALLLEAHQSRLLAEDFLGHPRTRAATVADALAMERHPGAAARFALLQEVFRRTMQVQLDGTSPGNGRHASEPVEIVLRHAAVPQGQVTGEVYVSLADAVNDQKAWRRSCILPDADDPAWQRHPDGSRSGRFPCTGSFYGERPEQVETALQALRTGSGQLAVRPRTLHLLPLHYDRHLPFAQAADRVLEGNCLDTSTCGRNVAAFIEGQPPERVVLGFALAQALLCWVLLRPRAGAAAAPTQPAPRASGWAGLGLAFLALASLAHLGAIGVGLQAGGMALLVACMVLGLPLFLPAMLLGLAFAFAGGPGKPHGTAKVVLGVAAATFPVLQLVLLSGVLK